MKKWIVFLLIVGVALGAGGFYIYNVVSHLQPPELVELSNEWGEVTEKTSSVHTKIVINNPNSLEINFGNLGVTYTLEMNDIAMAKGSKQGLNLKEGINTIELTTELDNTKIPEWFQSHVARGEETTLKILPEVTFSIFGTTFKTEIPEQTQQIQTDLLASLNSKETRQIEASGRTLLEIRETKASWGRVSSNEVPLDIVLAFYNPNLVPIPVTRIDYAIKMNDITMLEGTTNDPAILEPKQETRVYIETSLYNQKLDDWWVSHLQNNEATKIDVTVYAVLEIGGTEIPVQIVECTSGLQTDILNPEGETKSSGPDCKLPEIAEKAGDWVNALEQGGGEHKETVNDVGEQVGEVSEELPKTPTSPTTSTETKDTDLDGIPDDIDECPFVPETINGYQDEDGCPDIKPGLL